MSHKTKFNGLFKKDYVIIMRYLIVGLLLILLLEVHGVKIPKKDRNRNHTQRHQQELQLRHKLQQREEKLGNSSQFVDGKSKF